MKFFDFDNKQENITEKAFTSGIVISFLSIFLCIVALCSATFAWFGESKQSDNNTLVSGSFGLEIKVALKNQDASETLIDPVNGTGEVGVDSYQLSAGTYRITLTLADSATVKGYCMIGFGEGVTKRTVAIVGANTANREGYDENSPFTFELTLGEDTAVSFKAVWGVSVHTDIKAGQSYSYASATGWIAPSDQGEQSGEHMGETN